MGSIVFSQRAVAFIDVLGFSALVGRAATDPVAMETLERLIILLGTAIPALDTGVSRTVPTSDIPKHLYISDSLVLSAPLVATGTGYDGLGTVVMRTIQVSQLLLDAGFLVRGGIDVGQVWHDDANIVGPAYQCAYGIEQSRADPGVQLSGTAAAHWGASRLSSTRMCIECAGFLIVNPLEESYFPDANVFGGIEATYRRYENITTQSISSFPAAAGKWNWFKNLLEACAARSGITY